MKSPKVATRVAALVDEFLRRERTWWARLALPSPRNLSENGSLDSHQWAGIASKFHVRRLQEVLSDDRQFETLSYVPPQAEVTRAVGANALRGERGRISKRLVEFKMFRQIEKRLESHHAARA
jgi:hypothetical protein